MIMDALQKKHDSIEHVMMLEKTLRWIVLGGIFALPFIVFIVAQSLFFPFITGKNFAFRVLVEIVAFAYVALALVHPSYRPRRSWLLGAFAFFILVVALADAFGVYPFKSFWSNYERMDGWVTLAHLFAYFVVASTVLNTEKLWRAYWHVSLSVSAGVGIYGLLQLAGIVSLNPGFSSAARIDATFGNPIYLAAYMLFNVGIAATLLARRWFEGQTGRLPVTSLYIALIVLDTLVLFLTGTRGTTLGLIGGVLLAAFLIAFFSRESRRIASAVLIGILLLAGGFWLLRDAVWVQHVPFLQRLGTISATEGTAVARFYNWGMAWQGVMERPILGWGQENYAIVFDRHYDPRMYAQEQWFDRVHNIIFDWLVAAGFVGLLSYLFLLGAALWILWRPSDERGGTEASRPTVKSDGFNLYEKGILTGLIAAYFFHNLFVFDNITSYLLFTSILAFIAWRGSRASEALPLPNVTSRVIPAVLALLILWAVAWYVNARPLAANRALLKGLAPQQEGLQKNLEHFKNAVSYHSFGIQEAREQLAQAAAQISRAEGVSLEVKKAFLETAVAELSLMAQDSPLDARFPLFSGVLLDAYGDYANATLALERAHELSPKKQTILFELASNLFARGDTDGALARYKEAFELLPEYVEARIYYAAALIRTKQDARAGEILEPLVADGTAADTRIAAAYLSRGRYDKVIEVWEAHLKAQPNDVQGYFTLAAAYYGGRRAGQAIAILQKVGLMVPAAKAQADALIKEIRAGTAKIQ